MIDIKILKNDFDNGVVENATCIFEPMLSGYVLIFHYRSGINKTLSSQRNKKNSRIFKTADTAIRTLKDIGFRKVRFQL